MAERGGVRALGISTDLPFVKPSSLLVPRKVAVGFAWLGTCNLLHVRELPLESTSCELVQFDIMGVINRCICTVARETGFGFVSQTLGAPGPPAGRVGKFG